jgi:hypothetical protein
MQIADPSFLTWEGFTAADSSASIARQVFAFFFCLVPGGDVVSKLVVPPIRKTSRALPRSVKVSDAQYQLPSHPCQEENAKCR